MRQHWKKFIPKKIRNLRHLWFAWIGARRFQYPSENLFVIGVTGTSGKSSVIDFLRQGFEQMGYTVGSLSTVDFYVAGERTLNDKKMTMLGKAKIQEYLREMVTKKCDIAIVETTSEGRVQHRHRFINYDMMLLTNLYPEHIESHGTFEKYKQAKIDIFDYVQDCRRKDVIVLSERLQGQFEKVVPKIAIVNADVKQAGEFLLDRFDRYWTFGVQAGDQHHVQVGEVTQTKNGLTFSLRAQDVNVEVFGAYNAINIAAAAACFAAMEIPEEQYIEAIKKMRPVPGRIEIIEEAKAKGFLAIVDYAFEPVAIEALYDAVRLMEPKRIIHVFGSTGGGRDVSRRFSVGKFVGAHADIAIVTDEDPYDDDPQHIIDDVASAVIEAGKVEGENVFKVLDRRKAIVKAVQLAQPGDMLLVTGKGSEQAMVVKGELVPWDDREEVRKALA